MNVLMLQNLGLDWDERVLPSIGNEVVKAVVAQYNAEQLLTQRDKVSSNVSLALPPCLNSGLMIVDIICCCLKSIIDAS